MTQIKEIIWKELQSAPSIRLDLARKIINVRALAKYLQKKKNLTTSLDAIITAIRRFEEEKPWRDQHTEAGNVLLGATLSSKNGIAGLMLRKTDEVVEKLPRLFDNVEFIQHKTLHMVHAKKTIKLFLDENILAHVLDLFPKDVVLSRQKGLGEVTMELSKSSWNTPGVLGILGSELALNSINILETLTCIPELVFIFTENELMKAYEVLYRLSKGKE